ncbi:MAG: peptidylprolyl isomerase [Candidatus Anstonellaceae archaeon]
MALKINKGDILILELTGRISSTNSIFETTNEKEAKENGIWSQSFKYGPRVVIAQTGMMIKGIEEALKDFQIGEEKVLKISYEKAFGPRDQNLVRVISIKEFEKANLKPVKGMVITLDGVIATVKSINSGRVLLDFNHPLAGHDLVYKIKLLDLISDEEKKCSVLAKEFEAKIEIVKEENKKPVLIIKEIAQNKKDGFINALKSAIGEWAEIKIQS